jgi:hypothetical protein
LFLCFDALCNNQVFETLSHVNYGVDDGRIIGFSGDLRDKGSVNFQYINRKLPKVAEAGIPGAEIIHREVNAHRFEVLKHRGRKFSIIHKNPFGKLQFEISWFQTRLQKCGTDTFDKILAAELRRRNIDGNGHGRKSIELSGARLAAGFAKHPAADLENVAAIFGDRHELAGRYETRSGCCQRINASTLVISPVLRFTLGW